MSRHRRNFDYEDAYKVLHYRSDDDEESLVVWNSRDGVAPFSILSPATKRQLFHADWSDDFRDTQHATQPGEWIFTGKPSAPKLYQIPKKNG
jgi:hypothetical protein